MRTRVIAMLLLLFAGVLTGLAGTIFKILQVESADVLLLGCLILTLVSVAGLIGVNRKKKN